MMDMIVDITRGCQCIMYMHVENSSVGREAVMEGQER